MPLSQAPEAATGIRGKAFRHRIAPAHDLTRDRDLVEAGTSPQGAGERLDEEVAGHVHEPAAAIRTDRPGTTVARPRRRCSEPRRAPGGAGERCVSEFHKLATHPQDVVVDVAVAFEKPGVPVEDQGQCLSGGRDDGAGLGRAVREPAADGAAGKAEEAHDAVPSPGTALAVQAVGVQAIAELLYPAERVLAAPHLPEVRNGSCRHDPTVP